MTTADATMSTRASFVLTLPVVFGSAHVQELPGHRPDFCGRNCRPPNGGLMIAQADLVLRPLFRRDIDALDFGLRRECVAAGIRTVRAEIETIRRALAPGDPSPPPWASPASDDEA